MAEQAPLNGWREQQIALEARELGKRIMAQKPRLPVPVLPWRVADTRRRHG